MGTEVLRPQDCLLRPSPGLRSAKPLRRRREGSPKQPAKPRLAMGQVTILRRGESLEAAKARKGGPGTAAIPSASVGWDPALFGMGRLGPDPVMIPMIPKQIRLRSPAAAMPPDVYAGSAFDLSPSPRALPLPSFSRRKEDLPPAGAKAVVDCSATKDLRRLLRLE
ncbi:unnamed protein product [Musa hybrid cultivar]